MIFSIRTWKTDPFLLKLYFSYPKRWQRCALPSSEKVPFHIVVLFKHRYQVGLLAPSGLSSRLFISVRQSKHLESRAVYGLGILMYVTNGYVVQIRLRLRHPIFIRVCVCIHTRSCAYLCNKHTKHGSQYVTWRKFLVRLSSVWTENRYPMRLKKSDSHAQMHSYTCIWISALYIFLFLCHIRIWGKMPTTEIIITLFQEDNIFGTNASLTYGPQIQRHTCVW